MSSPSRARQEMRTAHVPTSLTTLLDQGVTKKMLRGPRWRRTSRGYYVPAEPDAPDVLTPTQRILDILPLVPTDGAVSGWAGAYLDGVDQLDGCHPRTMHPLRVLLYCGADLGRRDAPGVTYTREALDPGQRQRLFGVPVAGRLHTAFDGARLAENLREAVAFVDAYLHTGAIRLDALRTYVDRHVGWKGVGMARRAVALADPAARSTWESRLRVCYVADVQLPKPRVNVPIFDRGGYLLGIADLLDEDAGLVTEFDGQQHRTRRQHRKDNVREEGFESANLTVVRVDSLDMMAHQAEMTRRLQDGYRRGMRRDRRRDRWTTVEPGWWLEQMDDSPVLTDADLEDIWGRVHGLGA